VEWILSNIYIYNNRNVNKSIPHRDKYNRRNKDTQIQENGNKNDQNNNNKTQKKVIIILNIKDNNDKFFEEDGIINAKENNKNIHNENIVKKEENILQEFLKNSNIKNILEKNKREFLKVEEKSKIEKDFSEKVKNCFIFLVNRLFTKSLFEKRSSFCFLLDDHIDDGV